MKWNGESFVFLEEMPMYTVVALDLDGTLTNEKKEITPRTRDAIKRAREQGCHIVLASGRPLLGIEHVASSLDLMAVKAPFLPIMADSSLIHEQVRYSGNVQWTLRPFHTCFSYAREHHLAALSYDEEGVITEMADDVHVAKEAYNNAIPIRKVSNLIKEVQHPMPKVMIVGEPLLLQKAREDLLPLVGDVADLGFSEPCFMEITAKGVQKASSLQVLLSLLGKDESSLMVIGDGLNDLRCSALPHLQWLWTMHRMK